MRSNSGALSLMRIPQLAGTVEIGEVEFPSLRRNPLKDPSRRLVVVYLPPNYQKETKRYPLIVALAGFLGASLSFLNFDPFAPNLVQQADQLIKKGLPPFILAIPDGFTQYGGSQYKNSTATGQYEDMIVDDFISWLQKNFRVSSSIGLVGKSSGGYGALMLGMKHPEIFSALACHSGDMYFDWCYKRDIPIAAQVIGQYKNVENFVNELWRKVKRSPDEIAALNILAMSACYSPDPRSPLGFDLPVNLKTGELQSEIWKKWLAFDPVFLVEKTPSTTGFKV